ncbi:methyltransferase domain-containing protein [Maricaulis sp.]|uniref:methyltransferase domain-containing protein n=1 Tax=Maricaulis sp. TaxID=1486257 RepID=UPI002B267571|nr:methyltransferase domain-containing protein [Maricaulis sp.]
MTDEENRSAFDWETRFIENNTPWERGGLHPAFEAWHRQAAFRAGERAAIPGCGRSPELLALAQAGLAVTGADLSATAMAWQRQQSDIAARSVELITGDVLAWQPEQAFDLVYEQTFLCAIHPRLRGRYEQCLTRWLVPGGRLYALFMQKPERGGPPFDCSLEAMRTLFPAERWIWPDARHIRAWPHPKLNDKAELGAVLIKR